MLTSSPMLMYIDPDYADDIGDKLIEENIIITRADS
jgi:hypothetical protein